jgi:membrane protein implicated in regulation of membrane protease activity
MYAGARVLDVATALAFAAGLPLEEVEPYGAADIRSAGLAAGIATDVVLLVLASLLLRWLTRRWVRRQEPDPRLDDLRGEAPRPGLS